MLDFSAPIRYHGGVRRKRIRIGICSWHLFGVVVHRYFRESRFSTACQHLMTLISLLRHSRSFSLPHGKRRSRSARCSSSWTLPSSCCKLRTFVCPLRIVADGILLCCSQSGCAANSLESLPCTLLEAPSVSSPPSSPSTSLLPVFSPRTPRTSLYPLETCLGLPLPRPPTEMPHSGKVRSRSV